MPRYDIYGLSIDSEFVLPGVKSGSPRRTPDVSIRSGSVRKVPDGPIDDGKLYQTSDGYYVTVTDVGALHAVRGRRLVVEPASNAEVELLRQFVLGQGLRVLLHQRGYVVLHASATAVDGRAVAFLGESGAGKSTTVAGFHGEGHGVLADDVTPIHPETGKLQPGGALLKLTPDTVAAIDADFVTTHTNDGRRRYFRAGRIEQDGPLPLDRLYLLADGPEVSIEPLSSAAQTYELMCASPSPYRREDDEEIETHLTDCVQVCDDVPVKRLRRPRRYDALPAIVEAVENDLATAENEE